MHLFFYVNQAQFLKIKFNFENQLEDPSTTLSIYFVKKDLSNEGFFSFINQIMPKAYLVLFGSLLPRILEDLRTHLQLIPYTRSRDTFLFEKHTVIRVYGFEEDPFLLSSFLTPRVYAFEYMRQRFAIDCEHFSKYKILLLSSFLIKLDLIQ